MLPPASPACCLVPVPRLSRLVPPNLRLSHQKRSICCVQHPPALRVTSIIGRNFLAHDGAVADRVSPVVTSSGLGRSSTSYRWPLLVDTACPQPRAHKTMHFFLKKKALSVCACTVVFVRVTSFVKLGEKEGPTNLAATARRTATGLLPRRVIRRVPDVRGGRGRDWWS